MSVLPFGADGLTDLEWRNHLRGDLALTLEHADGDVRVELGKARGRDSMAGLADVCLAEEELRVSESVAWFKTPPSGEPAFKVWLQMRHRTRPACRTCLTYLSTEVGNLNRCGVVDRHTLHTSKGDVLGYESAGVNSRASVPISTPRPFMPTTRTLDVAIFFIAAWLAWVDCIEHTLMAKDVAVGSV